MIRSDWENVHAYESAEEESNAVIKENVENILVLCDELSEHGDMRGDHIRSIVHQSMIPPCDWIWYGLVGHLVVGEYCQHHLLTHIGSVLVSTVGMFIHPRHIMGRVAEGIGVEQAFYAARQSLWPGEDIGLNRKFETMVFKAGNPCNIEGCNCGQPELDMTDGELDMRGYNTLLEANTGHMEMCFEWAHRATQLGKEEETE